MKVHHELKCWDEPDNFEAIITGRKTFDIRTNDRSPRYKVGQLIKFNEKGRHGMTGRFCIKKIIYVQEGSTPGCIEPLWGIRNGWVGLGLADPDEGVKT